MGGTDLRIGSAHQYTQGTISDTDARKGNSLKLFYIDNYHIPIAVESTNYPIHHLLTSHPSSSMTYINSVSFISSSTKFLGSLIQPWLPLQEQKLNQPLKISLMMFMTKMLIKPDGLSEDKRL
jgi:hypothetical protein